MHLNVKQNIFLRAQVVLAAPPIPLNTKIQNKIKYIYIYERDRAQGILTVQPIHFEVRKKKKKIKDNIG